MRVGMNCIFEGHEGASDEQVWRDELRLADLAEPLGFDMLWSVEHHFTSYTMVPDVLQFLTYMAGRTERILLGSGAVILPWHNPIRVAEQVAVLDIVSGGRFIFGMGRGLGRIEFEGFGIPMDESRERFVEMSQIILQALETGILEYDGKYYQIPRRELRPRPTRGFRDRLYAAAVSPASVRIMADVGAGILINPQKDWMEVADDLNQYRQTFRELKGVEAPAPIVTGWVCCDKDPIKARDMAQYIGTYYEYVMNHYELGAGTSTPPWGTSTTSGWRDRSRSTAPTGWSTTSSSCRSGAPRTSATSGSSTSVPRSATTASTGCSPSRGCRRRWRSRTCGCSPPR